MRRYFILIASLAFLASGAGGAFAQDTPPTATDRIQSLVQPSIVYLETTFSAPLRDTNPEHREILLGGQPFSVGGRCTGFFVNPDGYVATAAHCILPDEAGIAPGSTKDSIIDQAAVELNRGGQFFNEGVTDEQAIGYGRTFFKLAGKIVSSHAVAYPTESTSVSSEETTAARRVGYRVFFEGDIGLLKFETSVELPGLELAEDEEVVSQTPIFAVGFPGSVDDIVDQDYNPTFSNGAIQRYGTREGRTVPVYQHGAEVSGGMSGGPVVTEDGRVIGVTSFGRAGETASFNIASPVSLLREVMGDKGVENDIGEVARIYREGVEAYYEGDKGTALDRLEEVLQNYPGNPVQSLAAPLRSRAEELPDEGGFPIWLLALIIAAAVIVAVIVVWMIVSRRRAVAPRPGAPVYAGVPAAASPPPLRTQAPPPALPPPAPAPAPAAAPPPPPAAATTTSGETGPALLVVGPRGETAVRHSLQGEMVIGREAADILLADDQVSRKHAMLRVGADGRVELSDLGSANGTEVNGQKVTSPVTLGHGDAIKVGNTELKLELPPSMRRSTSGETVITPRD